MATPHIHWKIERLDEGGEQYPSFAECLLEIVDRNALMNHFSTWGMKHLPGTRFMIATPQSLPDARAPQWPPCPILDQ